MPNTILEKLDELDALHKEQVEYLEVTKIPPEDEGATKYDILLHNSYPTISETLRRALAVVEEVRAIDSLGVTTADGDWIEFAAILRKYGFGE